MNDLIATKLSVSTSDSYLYGRKALYRAVVELLHGEGIAGATVIHGIEGYGADKQIHAARILELSGDLPVIIMAVDRSAKIEAVLPRLFARDRSGIFGDEHAPEANLTGDCCRFG